VLLKDFRSILSLTQSVIQVWLGFLRIGSVGDNSPRFDSLTQRVIQMKLDQIQMNSA
jgi:hypothetical protein